MEKMNKAKVDSWREKIGVDLHEVKKDLVEVKTDMSVVRNDVKWIKDNLSNLGNRQAEISRQVGYLRGWGSIVGIVLGSLIAVIGAAVFNMK